MDSPDPVATVPPPSPEAIERLRVVLAALAVHPCGLLPTAGEHTVLEAVQPTSLVERTALDLAAMRVPVPPRWARRALTAVGLRPADVGWWTADLSPWAAYAALKVEQDWDRGDADDAFLATAGDPEAVAAWFDGLGSQAPRVGDPVLADLLTESDDPRVAALAAMVQLGGGVLSEPLALEILLSDDAPPAARSAVADRYCTNDRLALDRADRDRLRAVTRTVDPELAVHLATLGTARTWSRADEGRLWWSALEHSVTRCRDPGRFETLTIDPGLDRSFAQVPPEYGPGGFDQIVADAAGTAGLRVLDVDCRRFPCVARLEPAGPSVSHLAAAWPDGSIAAQFTPDHRLLLAAVPGRNWNQQALYQALVRRVGPELACPTPAAMDELRRALASPLGLVPRTWQDALHHAAQACNLEPNLGPLYRHLVSSGEWAGSWRFEVDDPFLACVAERVEGPMPPVGARVRLHLGPPWYSSEEEAIDDRR